MSSDDTPPKSFNLAIVGGGISGLTLGIALFQHNIPVTIYEAAAHFGEIGAGVSFGSNAVRAMRLIHPKIHEAFEKYSTGNQWESKARAFFTCRVGDARRADKDGFVREGKKVNDPLFDVNFPDSAWGGVYRAHFLDELVKEVPEGITKFGKRLVDVSDATDGSEDKVLYFEDGSTAQHNAVIGTDGIKSVTRKIVLGNDDPAARAVYSGKYAYRGLIPMDRAIELLGEEEASNTQMYFGYHGHLLTFPVEKGKTMNGQLILPTTVTIFVLILSAVVAFRSSKEWNDEKWVVTTSKEKMRKDFDGWGQTVQSIVNEMQKPDIWALFYHPPANTFYKGRICLLGDAAHATTPHQGAGAGMCIEDALILSSVLKEANNIKDVECAFAAYDEVRRPRSQRNVKASTESGMLYEFELEGDDLDKIEKNFTTRLNWVWNVNLQDEVERAKKIYVEGNAKI
jgi:salicylate hydroxylase